ncbi:D-isomer specific 2-hydroxyacid dehydrogenase family protein [Conexibacter stalactiti]|uniref:D-isomer specific 2-hydroxyacid dehydrogenase family protein n=1 Tax=Conexibacter stalactiti TaxID=1940611 RepID=A0ABU4I2N5_9ACTN|nr:D-isomer specific 2-hydroxyacid dehydrogenase family protein [Conexibacter stalactiti]MDW5598549.1 D-isomer specific 2-hydroxyacid dehydrogenase family protein [Conexibacter stalactiti]MEC5039191.1 D-isomer specific 2-hydroxyacid dehydrogenase family protein [Conexibacter stalactiti]
MSTELLVHVGPDPSPQLEQAVRDGGGTLVGAVAEAEAIVWRGSPEQLQPLLHDGIRWVQLPSAGVEHWLESGLIDTAGARRWTAATGAYGAITAEHAFALLLAGLRRLPECARASSWQGDALEGGTLFGTTVAIIGAGGIGRALIAMLEPFGVTVLAVNRSGREVPGAAEIVPFTRVGELWPRADAVVLCAPATAETHHLLDAAALAALPAHAWVVNVARGSLVDTDALVRAFADGAIAGAALDVTDPEPLPADHPLWREPRALITPHTANPAGPLRIALAERVRENVARLREDRELLGIVDPARGY